MAPGSSGDTPKQSVLLFQTRSSAQCNCSVKSLAGAGNVINSSLSSWSSTAGGLGGGGGLGEGEG